LKEQYVSPRCLDIVEPQHREFEPIQVESASVAAAAAMT